MLCSQGWSSAGEHTWPLGLMLRWVLSESHRCKNLGYIKILTTGTNEGPKKPIPLGTGVALVLASLLLECHSPKFSPP